MSGIYEPEFYDYVTPKSFHGDAEWYRRKAMESGGPVLELGAGTGRIAIPIAEDGLSIYALDSDEGMRKALQLKVDMLPEDVRKRIVIVDDDMRSFRLNQEFGLIIAPVSVVDWLRDRGRAGRPLSPFALVLSQNLGLIFGT